MISFEHHLSVFEGIFGSGIAEVNQVNTGLLYRKVERVCPSDLLVIYPSLLPIDGNVCNTSNLLMHCYGTRITSTYQPCSYWYMDMCKGLGIEKTL